MNGMTWREGERAGRVFRRSHRPPCLWIWKSVGCALVAQCVCAFNALRGESASYEDPAMKPAGRDACRYVHVLLTNRRALRGSSGRLALPTTRCR